MESVPVMLEWLSGRARCKADRLELARAIATIIRFARSYSWVGIYDVEDAHIAAIGWTDQQPPAYPRFPITQGLNGAAVAAGSPVIVNDVTRDPRYLQTFGTTRAEAIFPVLEQTNGRVVGTIDVESPHVDAFTPEDRDFLAACAAAIRGLWAMPGSETTGG